LLNLTEAGLTLISASAAAISAFAAAIALSFNVVAVRQATRSRDLGLFHQIFTGIAQLEEKLQDAVASGKGKDVFAPWRDQFLNRLEHFAFLVNNDYLHDAKLVHFFTEAYLRWYEEIFLKLASAEEKTNTRVYPELKALYAKLTNYDF
jgi:hypothetical protein